MSHVWFFIFPILVSRYQSQMFSVLIGAQKIRQCLKMKNIKLKYFGINSLPYYLMNKIDFLPNCHEQALKTARSEIQDKTVRNEKFMTQKVQRQRWVA